MSEALSWYGEAKMLADHHRDRYGDDVVLHDPDDAGDMFVCEDCGWICTYAPIDFGGSGVSDE